MKFKFIMLLIMICIPRLAFTKQILCENIMYKEEGILKVKNILASSDIKQRDSVISYPMKVQYSGNFIKGYKSTLDAMWSDIFNETVIKKLKDANLCEAVKFLGIIKQNGDYKATQLVFNFDEDDLRYSYSSISSAKKLIAFLDDSNELAVNNPKKLSRLFLYPFPLYLDDKVITIRNECEFIKNINLIVTPRTLSILKRGLNENNFKLNPLGIMLDEVGTIWVVQYRNGDFLFMMNGSHINP